MNPVIFIDGLTEKMSIQKLCPGMKIVQTLCNGKKVEISAIAKRIATNLKILKGRHYPVIILIDREDRTSSIHDIKRLLTKELKSLSINDELLIGVCDRMIENWMLADKKNIKKYTSTRNLEKVISEGCGGKSTIKKLIPTYRETTTGVTLLTTSDPNEMYTNSESFKDFVETIKKIECKWLSTIS